MQTNLISTERFYYQDTYLDRLEATVIDAGQDEDGTFVIFDKTLFHPQGGGQPDDQGTFEVGGQIFPVTKLKAPHHLQEQPFFVKHYYTSSQPGSVMIYQRVLQCIDMQTRRLYARYHSAGHLISNAVHQLYPLLNGSHGNHFPASAFVVFEGPIPEDLQELKQKVSDLAHKLVQDKLPMHTDSKDSIRTIQFGDLQTYPCGGTHVACSSEIGSISIRNAKKNQGKLRVGYLVHAL